MSRQRQSISAAKNLRFRAETAIFESIAWLARWLPRRLLRALGRSVGWLGYYLAPGQRRIALANLDVAFGDSKSAAEKRRIARESFRTLAGTLATLFWAPRLTMANLDRHVAVDQPSLERLRELRRQKRGIVFTAMHYGDFELFSLATAALGVNAIIIQEAMHNEALGHVLARLRAATGHTVLPNRHAARMLLRALRNGGCIALVSDLNSSRGRGGLWLDFFGLPVFNSAAPGALALHGNAVIVGSRAEPLPDGRIQLIYGPFIEARSTGDKEADVRALNQQCLDWVEEHVRTRPELWMWAYKRWKYQPAAEDTRYPFYARPGRIEREPELT